MLTGCALGLALALLGACSDATCGPAEPCEITRASCQTHALEIASCYMQLEPDGEPEVRVRSIAELVEERQQANEARDETELRDAKLWRRGLALIGLTEPDEDPETTLEYELRWVAAQYSSEVDRITLVEEASPAPADSAQLLVHEYVHALQHRRSGEPAPANLSTDSWLALHAMREGEAELYEVFTLAEGLGFGLDELRDDAFETLRAHVPGRPYDDAYRSFTYDYGAWWAVHAWRTGGASAVGTLVDNPPASTRAVMAGPQSEQPAVAPERRADFEARAWPVLAARFRRIGWDTLGAWILTHFEVGQTWVGDSFHVFHDDELDATVAVWRVAFERAAEAERMQEAIEQRMQGAREDGGPVRTHDVRVDRDVLTWTAQMAECEGECAEVLEWQPIDAEAKKRFAPLFEPAR